MFFMFTDQIIYIYLYVSLYLHLCLYIYTYIPILHPQVKTHDMAQSSRGIIQCSAFGKPIIHQIITNSLEALLSCFFLRNVQQTPGTYQETLNYLFVYEGKPESYLYFEVLGVCSRGSVGICLDFSYCKPICGFSQCNTVALDPSIEQGEKGPLTVVSGG